MQSRAALTYLGIDSIKAAAIVACAGLAVSGAHGAIITWDGTIGDWDDDLRWGGAEPTSIDDVFINAGLVSVTGAGEVAKSTTVSGATLHVNAGALMATENASGELDLDDATLLVDNSGFLFSRSASIGVTSASSATLSGTNSQWDLSFDLNVGGSHNAGTFGGAGSVSSLDVNGGSVLQVRDLSISRHTLGDGSNITLDGAGTEVRVNRFLAMGGHSSATIDITGGVDVDVTQNIILGDHNVAGTTSTVNISGATTTVDAGGSLTVGDASTGFLNVSGGASVHAVAGVSIGNASGGSANNSTATISGAGSMFSTDGLLRVGRFDEGHLVVEDGATVSADTLSIANEAGSFQSSMIVRDSGSTVNLGTGAFDIGERDVGSLRVENGGVINATSSSVLRLGVRDSAGNGSTLAVTGDGSLLDATGALTLLGNKNVATATVTDGGHLITGESSISREANSGGSIAIVNGGAFGSAQWDVVGDLTVGYLDNADLHILDGGRVDVTGLSYLGRDAGSDGSSILIDGAGSTLSVLSTFRMNSSGNAASTARLTISNSGRMESNGGIVIAHNAPANMTITGSGSRINANGTGVEIMRVGQDGAGTVDVEDSGILFMRDQLEVRIGDMLNSTGVMNITGAGSTLNATGVPFRVGQTGVGSLNISDGAIAGLGEVVVGRNVGSQTSSISVDGVGSSLITDSMIVGHDARGTIAITNGATVDVAGTLDVGISTSSLFSSINVTGAGSVLNVASSLSLGDNTVGAPGSTEANLTISSGAELQVGQFLNIESTSMVTMTDRASRLTASKVDRDTTLGTLNWIGGTIEITGTSTLSITDSVAGLLNFGSGQGQSPDSTPLTLTGETATGRDLSIAGDLFLDGTKQLQVSGGSLCVGSIRISGDPSLPLVFSSGSITITNDDFLVGEDGPLRNDSQNLSDGQTLTVSGTTVVDRFATLRVAGTGGASLTSDTLLLDTASTLTNFSSGGYVDAKVIATAGSTIEVAQGNSLTIGNPTSNAGVYINGNVRTNEHTLSLLDANDAVFDSGSHVQMGINDSPLIGDELPGTIEALNGITIDFGANFEGFGTIDTPNTILTPLINNGAITGDALLTPITLEGFVKGAGTFDNVVFNGTFSPGLSPAISILGDTGFGDAARLLMELGGTTPGSEHDQLLLTGDLALGGTLDVELINGYTPIEGDTFILFDLASADGELIGAFSDINLPNLSGSLRLIWADASTLVVVPTPGSVTVLLGAGVAGLRRRRREG